MCLPLGTFQKTKQVYIETKDDKYLIIRESKSGPILAKHRITSGKGKLIQDTSHIRDRTKGIDTYIETVASYFSNSNKAKQFLQEIRKVRQRYIRDQLQMISKEIKKHNQELLDKALEECMKWQLFCATDFIDMVQYLNRQNVSSVNNEKRQIDDLKQFNYLSESVSQTKAQTRDIQEYVSVLEGEIQ